MVVQLHGEIDGRAVLFTRPESGDKWEATVPADLDGEYIVALWAVDDAGNEAYFATMLFSVDPSSLRVNLEPLWYYVTAHESDISCDIVFDKYRGEVTDIYKYEMAASGYYLSMVT